MITNKPNVREPSALVTLNCAENLSGPYHFDGNLEETLVCVRDDECNLIPIYRGSKFSLKRWEKKMKIDGNMYPEQTKNRIKEIKDKLKEQ